MIWYLVISVIVVFCVFGWDLITNKNEVTHEDVGELIVLCLLSPIVFPFLLGSFVVYMTNLNLLFESVRKWKNSSPEYTETELEEMLREKREGK